MGYAFHEGPLESRTTMDFQPALFNTPAFDPHQTDFFLVDEKCAKAVAHIRFHFDGKIARSPFRAPFGSVECAPMLPPGALFGFLQIVEKRLREKGAEAIIIKNPPRAYAPEKLSMLEVFLHNLGYQTSDAEVGACLDVSARPFREGIRHSEMLRIRQAERAGLAFRRCGVEDLDEVYDFLRRCYEEKKYSISISREDLRAAAARFPGCYHFSVVQREAETMAAAVSIQVTSDVVYNFLVNHPRKFNHLSPVLLLMEGIYDQCARSGVRLLDLGTSALPTGPNFPLIEFKVHIGGHPTSKCTFYKSLS